jgi:hypothetical protein
MIALGKGIVSRCKSCSARQGLPCDRKLEASVHPQWFHGLIHPRFSNWQQALTKGKGAYEFSKTTFIR